MSLYLDEICASDTISGIFQELRTTKKVLTSSECEYKNPISETNWTQRCFFGRIVF